MRESFAAWLVVISAVFGPPFVPCITSVVSTSSSTSIVQDVQADSLTVRKCIVGTASAQLVGDVLLLAEGADPQISNVGHLVLTGNFTTSSVLADDHKRNPVSCVKISETQWLIEGTGRVFVVATLATQTPFGIEQRRFDVVIPSIKPEPEPEPDPDPDVPPPAPDVPDDAFDNIGKRVAALSVGLPLRAAVAANYRAFADKLEGSVEAAELSRQMVEERSRIVASNITQWQPVLTMIATDFNTRRPSMLRGDVIAHWRAVAAGLEAGQ